MDTQAQVYDFLKLNGIAFDAREHAPVETMQDCACLNLPAAHCKNLFLRNRAGTEFTLLLLRADKPFVTREVSRALGVSRLSFAGEADLFRLLRAQPGAVSPMGLIYPDSAPVRLVCDRDLAAQEEIAFHPLVRTASLWMHTQDFFTRFLPACGHSVTLLEIS